MIYFRLIEDLPGRNSLGYGRGAGRWNEFGTPMIYACSIASLNFLELLSIKGAIVTKSKWKLIKLDVVGTIPELDAAFLPKDWKNRPYPKSTQEFGSSWVKAGFSPVVKIPSIRIPLSCYPQEHNLLINPLHADFPLTVKYIEEMDVSFEVNS